MLTSEIDILKSNLQMFDFSGLPQSVTLMTKQL